MMKFEYVRTKHIDNTINIRPHIDYGKAERAIMMLPQNKTKMRPIFRHNSYFGFCITTTDNLERDLIDNINCVLTFADFIETIDDNNWHKRSFGKR